MNSKLFTASSLVLLAACASDPAPTAASSTPDAATMTPAPKLEQHAWLEQLVGEWEIVSSMPATPGGEATTLKGKESMRTIGGLWVVGHVSGDSPAGPVQGVLTIGYDPEKKRFVGTWVDSMMNHLWAYEGTLDAAGGALTLEAQGPSMTGDGTTARYKDVYAVKSRDQKTLTSSMQGPDGNWTSYMTAEYRRVK